MSFIRAIKRGDKTYYQEVENKWINGKTIQKHIRYIGRDRDSPDHIPFEKVQFGYIATRLMQGDLSPKELFDIIENMGHHVSRENLEKIGLYYNFKKTPFPFHSTGRDHQGSRKMYQMRKKTERMLLISAETQNPEQRSECACEKVP